MRFKKGDRVRIIRDLKEGSCYNCFYVNDIMSTMAGNEVLIDNVYDGYYTLKGIDFNWPEDMLEPIKNEIAFSKFMNTRGFISGDIVIGYRGNVKGVIVGNNILWISSGESDILDKRIYKHIQSVIPIENINGENNLEISKFLTSEDTYLRNIQPIILIHNKKKKEKTGEKKKQVTVFQVEFTPNGKAYDFLSNSDHSGMIKVGDIVIANKGKHNKKYAKVINKFSKELTIKEISSDYKYIRPRFNYPFINSLNSNSYIYL